MTDDAREPLQETCLRRRERREPTHFAVRTRDGMVAGVDQNGTLYSGPKFQVFQTRAQAEPVADALSRFGGEAVAVRVEVVG